MFKAIRKLLDYLFFTCKRKERVNNAIWEFEDFWSTRLSSNVIGTIIVELHQNKLTMRVFPHEPNELIYCFEEPFNDRMLIAFGNKLIDKGYSVTPMVQTSTFKDKIYALKVSLPPNFKRRFAK